MRPQPILIHTASEEGHRGFYLALLSRLLNGTRTQSPWTMLFSAKPLFLLSIEGSAFPLYCFVAPVRALLGRRTVGLLMRPRPVLTGTRTRLRIKRYLLRLLRRLPRNQTLTILPFAVEPRFAEIADGWIHDPQIWDLGRDEQEAPPGPLYEDIRAAANGRPICCAVGRQNRSKGFDLFADLYAQHPSLREAMLFAFGGKVTEAARSHLPAFEHAGGYACNRFVTDAELLDLYAAADLIWCVYDPNYDQASGILGRAAQLGVPVVVRRDSLAHQLCRIEGLAHIAIAAATDWEPLTARPPRENPRQAAARAERMRDESLHRLREALGLPP